jgi:tRNA1(Val) A37 N6-methylase TrmN6
MQFSRFGMLTTTDTLLDGHVTLEQPKEGYRVAIDPIFLAAAVPAAPNESVLDVGAGVGAAMLCLAERVKGVQILGLEMQRELASLASKNIRLNHHQDRLEVVNGNLLRFPPRMAAGSYHHVMVNPPYYEARKTTVSPLLSKALANTHSEATLADWINFCHLMVRPKGTVTIIHRADYLDTLLALLNGKLGNIIIFPLWPALAKDAKRVIIQGRKNTSGPTRLSQGLVIHDQDHRLTSEADAILRHRHGLILS